MTRLTRIALAQPAITVLVMLLLLVGGSIAAADLNQELVPDVEFPQATVVTVWPGASAAEVTREIVSPLEDALEDLPDIDVVEVTSSASEGFAAVTVRAEFGTSQDELRDAIQPEVDEVDLPDDAEDPEVVLLSFGALPVVRASVRADLPPFELQQLVEDEVVPELEAIDGVSQVTIAGGTEEKVFIELDPDAMAERGISLQTIRQALTANDLSFPAGTLRSDGEQVPVQVSHRFRTPQQLETLVLVAGEAPAAAEAAPEPADDPAASVPDAGPFPLPQDLRDAASALLGVEIATTDDLTPEMVLLLEAANPDLLRQAANEIIQGIPQGTPPEALPADVVAALPPDVRADLESRLALPTSATEAARPTAVELVQASSPTPTAVPATATPRPTTQPVVPSPIAPATSPPGQRVRVVVVAAGDTVEGLATRFGVSPAAIREANDLTPGGEPDPGTLLRVPLSQVEDLLSPAWSALGARRAREITPSIMRRALDEQPALVSDLSAEQILALPDATLRELPAAFLLRQPPTVRAALVERLGALLATPTATPAGEARAPSVVPSERSILQSRPSLMARLLSPVRQDSSDSRAGQDGPQERVLLGDVADVVRRPEARDVINRTDGQPSLSLLVSKEQAANTVAVVDDVLETIEDLEDEAALEGVEFNTVFEQGSFIEEALGGVRNEGLLGGLFAVFVILIFLNFSVRSTIVAAVSIPLSIVVALLLMRVQGLTLNLLTLGGLTISIGRVVDDSIVVLENIYRHIQRGDPFPDAVIEGTREVATAITASTLVAVAVFLPLGFVGGLTSEFFLPFALTVTYALLASLLVAVTIVPLLARMLLTPERLPEIEADEDTPLQRAYTPALEWALDHRIVTLVLAFVFFGASLAFIQFIPVTFLPGFGEPALSVEMSLPAGTALETTDRVATDVESLLAEDSALGTVETTIGGGATFFADIFGEQAGSDPSSASFFVTFAADEDENTNDGEDSEDDEDEGLGDRLRDALGLEDEDEAGDEDDEDEDPDDIADRVRDRLAMLDTTVPVTFTVSSAGTGGPESSLFDLEIRSDDEALLRTANARVLEALRDPDQWEDEGYEDEIPLINLSSNLSEARDVLAVEVDPDAAVSRGLSTQQVAFALRQAIEGQTLTDLEVSNERADVVVSEPSGETAEDGTTDEAADDTTDNGSNGDADDAEDTPAASGDGGTKTLEVVATYPESYVGSAATLADFEIRGPQGSVSLGEVATIVREPGPVQITRIGGERAARLSAEITDDDTIRVGTAAEAIASDVVDDLVDERDVDSDTISVGRGVESSQQVDAFRDMFIALPISIAIGYLIMVVTFSSLVHPFTILFSVPFAISGALIALAVTGRALSISSMIGMMMLIGIVLTNAIVLVDLVQQYRARGMSAREALMRGGRVRVRPILMTALATVLALVPTALGFTEGALIASELATTVIGGLTTSTVLTLIIVPVVYSLLDGLTQGGEAPDTGPGAASDTRPMPPAPAPEAPPAARTPLTSRSERRPTEQRAERSSRDRPPTAPSGPADLPRAPSFPPAAPPPAG